MNKRQHKKRICKAALAAAVCACGIVIAAAAAGTKIPILMYHNIARDGEEINSMTVSESKFRSDMKYLAENGYSAVLPKELAAENFEIPDKPVMITFDDGYRSNYEIAFPILKEYGLKAEISVITKMIDEERDIFCTWDMLKEMTDSGTIEIGSHTHNLHNPKLGGALSPDGINGVQRKDKETDEEFEARVIDDIKMSFERIAEETGTEPVCFAYPFGSADKDADREIQKLFKVTLGTVPGTNRIKRRLYKLKRYEINETSCLTKL